MVISEFQGLSAEVAASALHCESYKQTCVYVQENMCVNYFTLDCISSEYALIFGVNVIVFK